jgi:hypothetical protein
MEEATPINTRTIRIDPRKLKLLAINARYMRHEVFARLVENLRKDGGMTGNTPFAWLLHNDATRQPVLADDEPVYEVLSGNHRVKAAIAADLPEVEITITDDYLTPDRRRSIQLSHNAITGEDDPAILKTIYESIENVEMRLYTGLDDKQLKLLADVSVAPLSEAGLEFQTIALTFLPHEVDQVNAIWEQARKSVAAKGGYWLARWSDYDRAMDALESAGQSYNVKNTATALMIVLDIFYRHLADLEEGYLDAAGEPIHSKHFVPTAVVFGQTVPARLAAKLKKLPGEDKLAELEKLIDEKLNT